MKRDVSYFALSLILFLVLALFLSTFSYLDNYLLLLVEGNQVLWLNSLAGVLTYLGSPLVIAILTVLTFGYLLYEKKRKKASFFFLTMLLGIIAHQGIWLIVQKARPLESLQNSFSFVSGHVMASSLYFWSVALLIYPKYKKVSWALFVVPFIVGFTRIYLMEHWFSDVLGAYLAGIVVITGVRLLEKFVWRRKKD